MALASEGQASLTAPAILTKARVEFRDADDVAATGALWARLEPRCAPSFFQSWGWIGCWLSALPAGRRPLAAVVRDADGETIGLGLFNASRTRRHRILPVRGYYLNESGEAQYDCLTIEYNGLLALPGRLEEAAVAAVTALAAEFKDWDELVLSGLDSAQGAAFASAVQGAGLGCRLLDEKPCHFVDLDQLKGADYLDAIGKNTRYQLRRALRLYEEDGPVTCVNARSPQEALQFMNELKLLHQAYWQARGKPGSFANAFFERFHRLLIEARFDTGEIQLARIGSPRKNFGYLYNFVHRGSVYAYQSGFLYEDDNRLKPGLVSHYLALEGHLREGARLYDFMAGEGQHKKSLGTGTRGLVWLVLQRPRLKLRIEDALRRWKNRRSTE